jgi:hypothetical protein
MTQDNLDPTRILDGWRADDGSARLPDPTRVLDGWSPTTSTAARPQSVVPETKEARVVLKFPRAARAQAAEDVTDVVDLADVTGSTSRFAASQFGAEDLEADWQPTPVVFKKARHPRLAERWQPGLWIGAAKQLCGPIAEILETTHGPVVETHPAHMLLALWEPPADGAAVAGRWPLRVQLRAVAPEDAGDALVALMPGDAQVWVSAHDLDWELVAELLLHHDGDLRPFQRKALKEFLDAERVANYTRLNADYRLPSAGQPVERKA